MVQSKPSCLDGSNLCGPVQSFMNCRAKKKREKQPAVEKHQKPATCKMTLPSTSAINAIMTDKQKTQNSNTTYREVDPSMPYFHLGLQLTDQEGFYVQEIKK